MISIDALRSLLAGLHPRNLSPEEFAVVIAAWLALARAQRKANARSLEVPILALQGEPGSGKSTLAHHLIRVAAGDEKRELQAFPRCEEDLAIVAERRGVLALDNVTWLPAWAEDALCRLVTGGEFSRRKLYTQDTLFETSIRAAAVLTSTGPVILRGDTLDRSLVIALPRILDEDLLVADALNAGGAVARKAASKEVAVLAKAVIAARGTVQRGGGRLGDFRAYGAVVASAIGGASMAATFKAAADTLASSSLDSFLGADAWSAALYDLALDLSRSAAGRARFWSAIALYRELAERVGSDDPDRLPIDPVRAGIEIKRLRERASRFVMFVSERKANVRGYRLALVQS